MLACSFMRNFLPWHQITSLVTHWNTWWQAAISFALSHHLHVCSVSCKLQLFTRALWINLSSVYVHAKPNHKHTENRKWDEPEGLSLHQGWTNPDKINICLEIYTSKTVCMLFNQHHLRHTWVAVAHFCPISHCTAIHLICENIFLPSQYRSTSAPNWCLLFW